MHVCRGRSEEGLDREVKPVGVLLGVGPFGDPSFDVPRRLSKEGSCCVVAVAHLALTSCRDVDCSVEGCADGAPTRRHAPARAVPPGLAPTGPILGHEAQGRRPDLQGFRRCRKRTRTPTRGL
jgi:hypothetical protein